MSVSRLDFERAIKALPEGLRAAFLLHEWKGSTIRRSAASSASPRGRRSRRCTRRACASGEFLRAAGDRRSGEAQRENMNCETYRQSVPALIEGDLDPEQQRALEAHAATCAACRTLTADLEASAMPRGARTPHAVEGRVGANPLQLTAEPTFQKAAAEARARSRPAARATRWNWPVLAMAASLLLALVTGSLYVVNLSARGAPPPTPRPRATPRPATSSNPLRTSWTRRPRTREGDRRSGAGGQRQRLAAQSGADGDVNANSA